MAPTIQALGIDKLSIEQQLALVAAIWENIAATNPGAHLTDSQREELRRRVLEDEAKPDDLIPWEQVKLATQARVDR